MHFSDNTSSFLAHCRSAISLSKHTLRAYTADLKDAGNFFKTKAPNPAVTKDDLRQYIRYLREERALKESSIKRRLATLKLLFRWLCEEEILDSNPFSGLNERIRLPRRLPRTLDRSHTALLQKAVSTTDQRSNFDVLCQKTAIQLLLETGIRVGELSSVSLDDLSLADRSLKIQGKGNRQRIVFILSPALQRSLKQYLSKRKRSAPTATDCLLLEQDLNSRRQEYVNRLKKLRQLLASSGM